MAQIIEFKKREADPEPHSWIPRNLRPAELALVDLNLVDEEDQIVECMRCGEQWTTMFSDVMTDWWICPNDCNSFLA